MMETLVDLYIWYKVGNALEAAAWFSALVTVGFGTLLLLHEVLVNGSVSDEEKRHSICLLKGALVSFSLCVCFGVSCRLTPNKDELKVCGAYTVTTQAVEHVEESALAKLAIEWLKQELAAKEGGAR